MITRRTGLKAMASAVAAMAGVAAGCTSTTAPTPTPEPTPTPTPTPSLPARDFTALGEARKVVDELVAYAGSIRAIKVELAKTAASLSVVSGMDATTYAWRDGAILEVDSDTRYVGQAIFDPRDYRFDDLAGLFATAAEMSRSTRSQQLQIVEYSDREVLMTVTTNPESLTVFFRKDGSLVAPVDLTTADGLGEALRECVGKKRQVLALGVLPGSGGCFVDSAGGEGVIVRTVRMSRLPVRTSARREATDLQPFDPGVVAAPVVIEVLRRSLAKGAASAAAWSVTVDRRGGLAEPRMHFTIGGAETVTTLDGTVVSR